LLDSLGHKLSGIRSGEQCKVLKNDEFNKLYCFDKAINNLKRKREQRK